MKAERVDGFVDIGDPTRRSRDKLRHRLGFGCGERLHAAFLQQCLVVGQARARGFEIGRI